MLLNLRHHILLTCSAGFALTACGVIEQRSTSYPSHAAAEEDGAVERGWIPQWVPAEASLLHEIHDLDTNEVCIRFWLPEETRSRLVANLRQLSPEEVEALPTCSLAPSWWFDGLIEQQPANDNALYAEVYEAPESRWQRRGYLALDRVGLSVFAWSR